MKHHAQIWVPLQELAEEHESRNSRNLKQTSGMGPKRLPKMCESCSLGPRHPLQEAMATRCTKGYVALLKKALGPRAALLGMCCVMLEGWSASVAWLKFIGDNLLRFVSSAPSSAEYITVLIPPLLLCAFLDDIRALERFSRLGLLAGQCFVALLAALTAPSWRLLPGYVSSQPFLRLSSFPVAIGVAAFCNEGMVVMSPSVSASMVEPERFTAAVTLAITYFTANYLLLSFCGDFLYSYVAGDVVAQEVTLSKAFSVTPIHSAAVVIYVLQLLLTFPSGLFMMFRNAEKLCASRASWQRRARRVVLILSFCGVAMILPRFADFLAVAGAVGNSMCVFILPHLAFLNQCRKGFLSASACRIPYSWLVVLIFGVCCGVWASVVSLQQLL
ncbi:unnamed protein product [Effrenium voratum]|nr:unnamed protein product [Effrenium voratum]